MLEFLIIIALIGLIPAAIASRKGRSFGLWWFYGAALFIVALPHSLIMKRSIRGQDARNRNEGLQQCPSCAEWIRPEARVCKHCGRDVQADTSLPSSDWQGERR